MSMSLLEIINELNKGATKLSKEDYVRLYREAKNLPKNQQTELWQTHRGHMLSMAGEMFDEDDSNFL